MFEMEWEDEEAQKKTRDGLTVSSLHGTEKGVEAQMTNNVCSTLSSA